MAKTEDYYQILGLRSNASMEDIKQAYRDLVNVWHPDRFSHNPRLQEKAQEKLKEINIAFEKLRAYLLAGYGQEIQAESEYRESDTYQPSPNYEQSFLLFDSAHIFSEGLGAVKIREKWGFIDKTGEVIIYPRFDETWGFSEGLAAVRNHGKSGFIDKTGNYVITPEFDFSGSFFEGLARMPIPLIPATHSDPWRPLVPIHGGHLGRSEATLEF